MLLPPYLPPASRSQIQLILGGGTLLGQTIAGFTISYVPKVKLQTILAALSAAKNAELFILGLLGATAIGFIDNIVFPGVTLVFEAQNIGLATGVMGSIRAMGGSRSAGFVRCYSRR